MIELGQKESWDLTQACSLMYQKQQCMLCENDDEKCFSLSRMKYFFVIWVLKYESSECSDV